MISINTAAVMAMDQLTNHWLSIVFSWGLSAESGSLKEAAASSFGFDFSYLFDPDLSIVLLGRKISSLTWTLPNHPRNLREEYYQTFLANISIAWLMLHELAHVLLGHVRTPRGIKEGDVDNPSPDDADAMEAAVLYKAEELEADTLASQMIISMFHRADAIENLLMHESDIKSRWFKYLQMSAAQVVCLMEKLRFSRRFLSGLLFDHERRIYPSNYSRLFNVFVATKNGAFLNKPVHQILSIKAMRNLSSDIRPEDIYECIVRNIYNVDFILRSLQIFPLLSDEFYLTLGNLPKIEPQAVAPDAYIKLLRLYALCVLIAQLPISVDSEQVIIKESIEEWGDISDFISETGKYPMISEEELVNLTNYEIYKAYVYNFYMMRRYVVETHTDKEILYLQNEGVGFVDQAMARVPELVNVASLMASHAETKSGKRIDLDIWPDILL